MIFRIICYSTKWRCTTLSADHKLFSFFWDWISHKNISSFKDTWKRTRVLIINKKTGRYCPWKFLCSMIGYEFKELWQDRVNWLYLVQDKIQWWAFLKTTIKLVVPLKVPNVLTWRTVNLISSIRRDVVKDTTFIVRGRDRACNTPNVPRQCPLVLLAKDARCWCRKRGS